MIPTSPYVEADESSLAVWATWLNVSDVDKRLITL